MSDVQRVLVTAGASGIGYAIAQAFAKQDNTRVHIADVDAQAVDNLAPQPQISASVADVSVEEQVEKLHASACARLGGDITVLVNCAGIAGAVVAVESLSCRDWDRCIAVNLNSAFLCIRAVAAGMKAVGGGAIINLSSTAGLHGYPLRAAYAAAKWGLIGLTKTVAMELGPSGVRVNAICPGSVEGERMDRVIAAESKTRNIPADVLRTRYARAYSMRTFVSAQDVANMAVFLASPQAVHISGQAIAIDGHTEDSGGLESDVTVV